MTPEAVLAFLAGRDALIKALVEKMSGDQVQTVVQRLLDDTKPFHDFMVRIMNKLEPSG